MGVFLAPDGRRASATFALALLIAPAASLAAQGISPTGTFGAQPTFTFSGTNIPNSWVMTNSNPEIGVTLGLTATARYVNPAVTNDGAGTFFAASGVDLNPPSGPLDPYARWNFDFFVGGDNADLYTYELLYDFDPGAGTAQADLGSLDPACLDEFPVCFFAAPVYPDQDSWNLGMDFLTFGYPFDAPPTYGAFDPTASGEYSFALLAFDANGGEAARSAINVDVAGSVVPEPATMSMLAMGLVGLAGVGRRRKKLLK